MIYMHLLTWVGFGLIGYLHPRHCLPKWLSYEEYCRQNITLSAGWSNGWRSRKQNQGFRVQIPLTGLIPPLLPTHCVSRLARINSGIPPIDNEQWSSWSPGGKLKLSQLHRIYQKEIKGYFHTYIPFTLYPRRDSRGIQIFLWDTHVLPKWVSCEEHCRRDRW
jgi:hypothetical protein